MFQISTAIIVVSIMLSVELYSQPTHSSDSSSSITLIGMQSTDSDSDAAVARSGGNAVIGSGKMTKNHQMDIIGMNEEIDKPMAQIPQMLNIMEQRQPVQHRKRGPRLHDIAATMVSQSDDGSKGKVFPLYYGSATINGRFGKRIEAYTLTEMDGKLINQ